MNKIFKNINLLFYFFISLLFMEIIFRVATIGEIKYQGLMLSAIFMLTLSIIFFLLSNFLKGWCQITFASFLLIAIGVIYSSQIVYYKFFRTFYSVFSAGNTSQVLEFSNDILNVTQKNVKWILLLLLPSLIVIIFGKKKIISYRVKWFYKVALIGCIISTHIIGLITIFLSEREQYSPYDLYFNNNSINLSVNKLGLITTMRLDLQRLLTGWSPKLRKPNVDIVAYSNKDFKEEKIEYNTMNINFDNLIDIEKNSTIKEIHNYFNTIEPTSKNEYTGKYEGYNLIFITAESFAPYAVHKDLTPTLYKMINEGYNFTNFYNPIWNVSTTDGEYVACTSLIPKSGVWSFDKSSNNYLPFVMGNQFKKLGYKTLAYHNHSYKYYNRHLSHPNMGYDYKGLGNGLNVKKTWPESDLEMMEKTIPEYIDNEPFHTYYMTVSGHMQYNFFGNQIAHKNKNLVNHLNYSTEAKAYIATQIELDKALKYLLDKLEEKNIADKTLIVLSADHYPYGLKDKTINELSGHKVEKNFEIYKSPLIIYTADMNTVTIDKPCSSLDIIPTISNLLGLEYDSRLLMGKDIFSDSDPLVMFLNRSYITDKGRYNAVNKKFTPNEGEIIEKEYTDMISYIVDTKFYYSAKILETDYYNKVLEEYKKKAK